ncbi:MULTISPECIES: hypothetical protein [Protofrankia]|uniref:Uncharacterized protein n=1 Tax=Candidatus Protofrankia datiscae TaxID=2716812 RepID=F8B2S0_9ACTN|nr:MULTISPECIES: hypothetical protein [Protofrankia]AEH07793.1 hypothetical protein FsymDg_0221 [Candidatus Protofrankia datiscae]
MEADRVVAAIERYVFQSGEEIESRRDWPDAVVFHAGRHYYSARLADWLIGWESWVEYAVQVVVSRTFADNDAYTYGLLFAHGGEVLFLNDVATIRELGRRLDVDLDPLAYAELLSELYSVKLIDEPVVLPNAATTLHRAGELVRDVNAFAADYPWVDAALVAAPAARREDGAVVLEFFSCHYYITGLRALDVLRWRVSGGGGRPASWEREYVAERLEHI